MIKYICMLFIFSSCLNDTQVTIDVVNESLIMYDSATIALQNYTTTIYDIKIKSSRQLSIPLDSIQENLHDVSLDVVFYYNGLSGKGVGYYYSDLGGKIDSKYLIVCDSANKIKVKPVR